MILNHAGPNLWFEMIVTESGPYGVPFLRGLFRGGGVVVFFVVGGFIVGHSLLREHERGVMDPVRFLLRRLVRLGVQLLVLAVVLVTIQILDPTAPGTMLQLVQSLGHVLTYTLNLVPYTGITDVRGDTFHLWYLSVQQQCYLLLPLFIVVFARWRALGIACLTVLIAAVYLERQRVTEISWVDASIFTTTRSDGLLWGVLLAFALPVLSRYRRWSPILFISTIGMLVCQLSLQELEPLAEMGPWSLVMQGFIGLALVSIWLQDGPSYTARLLGSVPLTWLGRNSLTLYIWHLPVFFVVHRHLEASPWWVEGSIAAVGTGLLAAVFEPLVEQPTRRLLAAHKWFRSSEARA